MPDWEVNEGLTAADWGPPRFWVQAGLHDPDVVLARFDHAYDEVQTFFMDQLDEWTRLTSRRRLAPTRRRSRTPAWSSTATRHPATATGSSATICLHDGGQRRQVGRLGRGTDRRRTTRRRPLRRVRTSVTARSRILILKREITAYGLARPSLFRRPWRRNTAAQRSVPALGHGREPGRSTRIDPAVRDGSRRRSARLARMEFRELTASDRDAAAAVWGRRVYSLDRRSRRSAVVSRRCAATMLPPMSVGQPFVDPQLHDLLGMCGCSSRRSAPGS